VYVLEQEVEQIQNSGSLCPGAANGSQNLREAKHKNVVVLVPLGSKGHMFFVEFLQLRMEALCGQTRNVYVIGTTFGVICTTT
jgi:hypothetical protein